MCGGVLATTRGTAGVPDSVTGDKTALLPSSTTALEPESRRVA